MILNLYLIKKFARALFVVFFVAFWLIFFASFVEQVRILGNLGLYDLAFLSVLQVPLTLHYIKSMLVMIATMVFFISLARSSELVIMRTSGHSAISILAAPVGFALLLGIAFVVLFNPIVAATVNGYDKAVLHYQNLQTAPQVLDTDTVLIGENNIWLREGNREQEMIVRIERTNATGERFFGLTFLIFNKNHVLLSRITAKTATLTNKGWQLYNGQIWHFVNNDEQEQKVNPIERHERFDRYLIPSDTTKQDIQNGLLKPISVSVWQLPLFMRQIADSGLSLRRYQVWFQAELASPLVIVSMVIIGASLVMQHMRFAHLGMRALVQTIIAFVMFAINKMLITLGDNEIIPIVLAAWGGPVLTLSIASAILLHNEDV